MKPQHRKPYLLHTFQNVYYFLSFIISTQRMKLTLFICFLCTIVSITGRSQSNDLIPQAKEINIAYEQLQEKPNSKEIQIKYVEVFPEDADIFKKVFHSPKFDQLYMESHLYIFKLAELSESFPDEVGRKLVKLCLGLKEWDADAIGHIQHVTIGFTNSHYDTFMVIISSLDVLELEVLATFLADVENHAVYSDYNDFLKKLQANGEQTVYDVFKRAKEDRISRKDHAF